MFALIAAKREFLAAFAEEQIRFAVAKELLQSETTPISQEALLACAEADNAMDRLQAAIQRIEQLELN
jgi:hypothetical protein